jgi:hypothetical protein
VITSIGWLWLTEARGRSQNARPCPPTPDPVSHSHVLLSSPPAPAATPTGSCAALVILCASLAWHSDPPSPWPSQRPVPPVLLCPGEADAASPWSSSTQLCPLLPATVTGCRCCRLGTRGRLVLLLQTSQRASASTAPAPFLHSTTVGAT